VTAYSTHDIVRLLRGLYLDARQDMGELIAEVKKSRDSHIKLGRLYYLKADLRYGGRYVIFLVYRSVSLCLNESPASNWFLL